RTLHYRVNVTARGGYRQKSDCGEHRVSASHVVRDNERLVALLGREILKCALALIGSCKDPRLCFFLAVLVLHQLFKYSKGKSRLGGGAGLGSYIYADIPAFANREDFI